MKNNLLSSFILTALGLSVSAQQLPSQAKVQWVDAMNLTEVGQGWGR